MAGQPLPSRAGSSPSRAAGAESAESGANARGARLMAALPDLSRTISAAVQLRLNVAREIVSSIPTLTVSGRHFAMRRVLELFNDDVRRHMACALCHTRGVGSAWLEQLKHEAARPAPDSDAFRRTAESLIDALAPAV